MCSVAFTKGIDAEKAIRTAEMNAVLVSENIEEPIRFAKADVVKDTFSPKLEEDPRRISIDEKLELTRKYNNLPLKYEKIATTNIGYMEVIREKYFVNTEGSEIREDLHILNQFSKALILINQTCKLLSFLNTTIQFIPLVLWVVLKLNKYRFCFFTIPHRTRESNMK
ncbi:hypothetical protein ES705_12076 [subsurface metagenome]